MAQPGTGTGRRIFLFFDGTWNDIDFGTQDTNVVRLREHLAAALDPAPTNVMAGTGGSCGSPRTGAAAGHGGAMVSSVRFADVDHLVFYERGVGTGALDRIRGGAFGEGLAQNVRRGYRILARHYAPGDEVFVFGFSRGAYTARSLVGMLHAVGLLRCADCTPANERTAWEYYRSSPNDRLSGTRAALSRLVHPEGEPRIACLGVFDTVGALGIPSPRFALLNRDRYEFHDVRLSPIVQVSLQALAIDEHRWAFSPTLWRRYRFKRYGTTCEQVWFAGGHADVGGGEISAAERAGGGRFLDDISLDWMLRRLQDHFPTLPFRDRDPPAAKPDALPIQHDRRRGAYLLQPKGLRAIANRGAAVGRFERITGADRFELPTGEMVHVSALERFGRKVSINGRRMRYRPPNLLAVAAAIRATYAAVPPPPRDWIPVVDWSGKMLEPGSQKCRDTVAAAMARFPRG
ncbi:MAG: DUF2235 domain-containing protein [Gluconacetobacter diazotrophicus]|nr:DUF2235 domain-containing protein [Gluconacetobacter diazotrophicus]